MPSHSSSHISRFLPQIWKFAITTRPHPRSRIFSSLPASRSVVGPPPPLNIYTCKSPLRWPSEFPAPRLIRSSRSPLVPGSSHVVTPPFKLRELEYTTAGAITPFIYHPLSTSSFLFPLPHGLVDPETFSPTYASVRRHRHADSQK